VEGRSESQWCACPEGALTYVVDSARTGNCLRPGTVVGSLLAGIVLAGGFFVVELLSI